MRLKEWKDGAGNKVSTSSSPVQRTSSGSFKKRLNKLITYYGQHLPKGIDYINVGLLTTDTLNFVEHYDTGSVAEIKIYIGPTTEAWNFKVWTDGKLTDDLSGMGWTELLKTLRAYITVPVVSTPEYKNLLTEWVDSKGKKVSLNNSSTASQPAPSSPKNYQSQEDRYKNLLAQIISDNICKCTVNTLDDRILDITVDTKFKTDLKIKIVYKPYVPCYLLQVNNNKELTDLTYEDILELLQAAAIIENTDLINSTTSITSSIVEDFKLYENLWD